jgi:hypothetical protein
MSPYDPFSSQPRTLDHLGQWIHARLAAAGTALAILSRFPVSLDPPGVPGLEELRAYSWEKCGTDLITWDAYQKILRDYCRVVRVADKEAASASLQTVAEALASKQSASAPVNSSPVDHVAHAIALLASNPRLTNSEIAKQVGVTRQAIYKPNWKPFWQACERMGRKRDYRRGHKRQGDLEAYADDPTEHDDN